MLTALALTVRVIATAATNGALHDLPPRTQVAQPADVAVRTFTDDVGALKLGPWLLWRRDGVLTPAEARRALRQGRWNMRPDGLRYGRRDHGWWSAPEPAEAHPPGDLTWCTLEDAEHGVWELVTDAATASWPDWTQPPEAWTPVWATRLEGLRQQRPYRAMAFGETRGGTALETQASREASDAIRVDLGNHVDNVNDDWRRAGLPDTLHRLEQHPLAALVPWKFELRLPLADQRRLAVSTPLVAANLIPPSDVTVHPWRIVRSGGVTVGLVGAADARYLSRYGLVDGRAPWRSKPAVPAVREAIEAARAAGATAILLLTNMDDTQVDELDREIPGFAAILRARPESQADLLQRTATRPDDALQPQSAWLQAGADQDRLLQLDLTLSGEGAPASITSRIRPITSRTSPPEASLAWLAWTHRSTYIEPRRALILPGRRRLEGTEDRAYSPEDWGNLLAATVRTAAGTELALVPRRRRGLVATGDIPDYIAQDWVPANLQLVRGQISGRQLRNLVRRRDLLGTWALAGTDADAGRVAGRPLLDDEVYSLVTTDSFAHGAAFQGLFRGTFTLIEAGDGDGDGQTELQDVVLARWRAAAARGWGGAAHLNQVRAWLQDDGATIEPQWRLSLQPIELNGQQLTGQNRTAFAGARNALVTAPEAQALRARFKGQAHYEDHRLVWDTTTSLLWDQSTITGAGQNTVRRDSNEARVGSEVRGRPAAPEGGVVPFLNGGYATDLVPGTNASTGLVNPRRQDVTAGAGLVWTSNGMLKEARLGASTRRDFSVTDRVPEPGYQAGLALQWPLSSGRVTLDVDARGFGPTPQDTAADLGLLCQVGLAYRQPVAEGLELRVGVDSLLFQGKVDATRTLGSTVTPSIGLSWQANWKPVQGVTW
ncbi:MAG: hypothetical protein VKP57_08800 [Candidatus Sericytochromatia bacterium]|nr:hypothetical protein [Candidatus Sericytochromatia bacterium]